MITTQQRLLETGLDIARRHGLRSLTVRGLALQAGVNPGSFVYHFGTRERFIEALIEHWYAPLLERLTLRARAGGSPQARLLSLLEQLLDNLLDHGSFIGQLFMDATAGEAGVLRFIATLGDRHIRLMLEAVADAQRAGQIQADEPIHVLMFIMAAAGLPALLHFGLAEPKCLPAEICDALDRLAADRDHVRRRLRWALAGVAYGAHPVCNDVP
ncbi:TetR/AcrR family transcriptional regulator [Paludibacterium yongneupense]|uniref:TetR/AcrR family transcriptional regulator n=1 Tax=Paludibacterium yongneupense TaxID=400061 RepID=UPI000428199A|nr:TetR/AcrR family transcriptional regulator [Paludibacterium yongneupense]